MFRGVATFLAAIPQSKSMTRYKQYLLERRINFILDCGLYLLGFVGILFMSLVVWAKYF